MRDFQRFTLLKSQSQVNRQVGAVDHRDLIFIQVSCRMHICKIIDYEHMANKKPLKISVYYNCEQISFERFNIQKSVIDVLSSTERIAFCGHYYH